MTDEIARAEAPGNRTWFGTLTLSPAARDRVRMEAIRGYKHSEWYLLSQEKQTASLALSGGKYVTLFIKRVREESGAALRYCLVAEAHKDGMPHWHMLVHEVGDIPIRHACLSGQWRYGYSNWKLVESEAAAGYVAKYIAKAPLTRVRASVGYGQGPNPPSGDPPINR